MGHLDGHSSRAGVLVVAIAYKHPLKMWTYRMIRGGWTRIIVTSSVM